ncbi:MAG: DUF2341 domain-containing protein [Candidatus Altiarchaeota archaeon]|nr:DUF2341 domain-containing protein [Candidatus Altiarchaeota archaeon]
MNLKQRILAVLVFFILCSGLTVADYGRILSVQENSGRDLSDYQVLVNLSGDDFPVESAAGGSDIRFYDMYGLMLPYWIESFDPSSPEALIWVRVPFIPANETAALLVSWGEPSLPAVSNASAVFECFDDFESGSLGNWQVVAASWSIINESGNLVIRGSGGSNTHHGLAWKGFVPLAPGIEVKARVKNIDPYSSSPGRVDPGIYWGYTSLAGSALPGYAANSDNRYHRLRVVRSTGSETILDSQYISSMSSSKYYTYILRVQDDGSLSGMILDGDSVIYSTNAVDLTYVSSANHPGLFADFDGKAGYWDDFVVRKYTYPEPNVSISELPVPRLFGFSDNFSSDSGMWTYVGSAYRDATNEYVVLTTNGGGQVGVVWLKENISSNFSVDFRYLITYCGFYRGDGMVFMFYKDRNYVPGSGGALGFIGSPSVVPGYGVEFQTWLSNHVSLIKDSVDNHLKSVGGSCYCDGVWHNVSVRVNDSGVSVFRDGAFLLSWSGTMNRSFGGFGFSAATGMAVEYHIIDDFRITAGHSPSPPEPGPAFNFSISDNQTTSVGGDAVYALTLSNPNMFPLILNLSVSGLDAGWFTLSDESVLLVAGETRDVLLYVSVPEDCGAAGVRLFSVSAGGKSVDSVLFVDSAPIISDLIPHNYSTLSSNDVLFSWKTSVNSSTELFLKEESEPDFSSLVGVNGLDHVVLASNLTRNMLYSWYVRSYSVCGCSNSSERVFYVDNGVVFTQDDYFFNVERDYNQYVILSVRNLDSESHTLLVQAMNPYDDLIVGFVGNGSLDQNLGLDPGESADMHFMVHAQDAMLEDYSLLVNLTNLGVENISDYAVVHVHVRRPNINFTLTELSVNPVTLAKTYKITNYGDPITDLKVSADDSLSAGLLFNPVINHGNLRSGNSVEFEAIPVLFENFTGIVGEIRVQGLDSVVVGGANFTLPPGKQVYLGKVYNPQLCIQLEDWYCSNRPNVDIYFDIPAGYFADNSQSGTLRMSFDPNYDNWHVKPHNVYLSVNGHSVGSIINRIPEDSYSFSFSPELLHYSESGVGRNVISLRSTHPPGHYSVYYGVGVCTCLDEYSGYVVATSSEEASELLWSLSFLFKSSSFIDFELLSPLLGEELVAGRPTVVRARVIDDGSGGTYPVNASFSGGKVVWLFDDGKHGDEVAGDGVYTNYVVPPMAHTGSLNLYSENCVTSALFELDFNISLLPDLAVSSAGISFSNPSPAVNESITVDARVHNIGYDNISDVRVQLFVGSDTLSEQVFPFLPVGSHVSVSANWTASAGDHLFSVFADPYDAIPEVYETNNFASRLLSVGGGGGGGGGGNGTGNETAGDLPDLAVYGHEIIFMKIGGGG